ncbi:hypothetical protein [Streptosporangium roseum]|uniref:hypothetical protein n=1 Tax=Streptosporangium roseum TaxID=2001 RepID=UPI003D9F1D5C
MQDLLGHADPRTTRRYDRARGALHRSPAYRLGQDFAHGEARHAEELAAGRPADAPAADTAHDGRHP